MAEPSPAPVTSPEPASAWDGERIVEGAPARTIARREGRYRRALALVDVLAYAGAMIVWLGAPASASHRAVMAAACLGAVLAGKACGLYDRDELLIGKTTIDEAPRIFQLAALFVLAVSLAGESLLDEPLGAGTVLGLWSTLFVIDVGARWGVRALLGRASGPERCLVIAHPRSARRIQARLDLHGRATVVHGLTPVRANELVDHGARSAAGLRRLVERYEVHRIILEPSSADPQRTLDLIRAAKAAGAYVSILPHALEVVGTAVEFDDVSGMTLLGVRRFGLPRSSLLLKRAFDAAGAGVGLLFIGLPLAVIALAIKLDSPGPVFFRQRRVGRDGKHFRMVKFRTMVLDAEARKADLLALNEADGLFKIAEDPRITRVGRLLRRTSLDELPQLLNVLRGEMSLVGPRPLISHEDAQVEGWYRHRLALTPGMTGRWQIAGSSQIPLAEMMRIDYLYVAGWSLWGDLKILIRTVPYVLGQRGL